MYRTTQFSKGWHGAVERFFLVPVIAWLVSVVGIFCCFIALIGIGMYLPVVRDVTSDLKQLGPGAIFLGALPAMLTAIIWTFIPVTHAKAVIWWMTGLVCGAYVFLTAAGVIGIVTPEQMPSVSAVYWSEAFVLGALFGALSGRRIMIDNDD